MMERLASEPRPRKQPESPQMSSGVLQDRRLEETAVRESAREANRLLALLIGCNLLLVSLHVIFTRVFISAPTLTAWFNLDGEMNVPTWFSSMQLCLCSLLSVLVGMRHRQRSALLSNAYYLLAGVFAFVSLDEVATIHEHIGSVTRELWPGAPSLPYGNSIAAYVVVALVLVFLFWKSARVFLAKRQLTFILVLGAAVWVCGAVGCEVVGLYLKRHGYGISDLLSVEIVLEESFEMLGQSLLISALIQNLQWRTECGDGTRFAAPSPAAAVAAVRSHNGNRKELCSQQRGLAAVGHDADAYLVERKSTRLIPGRRLPQPGSAGASLSWPGAIVRLRELPGIDPSRRTRFCFENPQP